MHILNGPSLKLADNLNHTESNAHMQNRCININKKYPTIQLIHRQLKIVQTAFHKSSNLMILIKNKVIYIKSHHLL